MTELLLGVLCILIWVILTFVRPLGVGITHLFLGVGVTLLVRWWALRKTPA